MKTLFKRFLMLLKTLICALCTHLLYTKAHGKVDKAEDAGDEDLQKGNSHEKEID